MLSIAESNASLLEHVSLLEIGQSGLSILQRVPVLNALKLSLDYNAAPRPLDEEAVSLTFKGLSQLQIVELEGNYSSHDCSSLLRGLARLPDLRVLSVSQLTMSSDGFELNTAFKGLQQLCLSGCCTEIMQQILQAIAPYRLQVLEIGDAFDDVSFELVLPKGIVSFPELSKLSICFGSSLPSSGFAAYFTSLQSVEIYGSYLDREDTGLFLESLPPSVRYLEMLRMKSLEIFKPLFEWLACDGQYFADLSLTIELFDADELDHDQYDYTVTRWTEAIKYSSRSLALAAHHGITIEPQDLPDIIRRMQEATQTSE